MDASKIFKVNSRCLNIFMKIFKHMMLITLVWNVPFVTIETRQRLAQDVKRKGALGGNPMLLLLLLRGLFYFLISRVQLILFCGEDDL